ncbi:hypothetical protein OB13_18685, partial [Pontibacter sp. HJ8]
MKSTLVLRNKSEKTGKHSVYVEYSYKGKIKRIPTGIKVAENQWNGEKGLIKKGGSESHDTDNQHIHSVKKNIDGIILKHMAEKGVPPTVSYVGIEYDKLNDVEQEKVFVNYIDEYIELRKSVLTPNTIKGFTNLKANIEEYQKQNNKVLNFDDINTLTFFNDYCNFLISKKYYNSTISKRLSVLKTILTHYYNLGLSKSINFKLFKFSNRTPKNQEVVTLSVSELEALKGLDLSDNKRLEQVRDLFIVQSWTGLRYSDVVRLSKKHIVKDTIKVNIVKTKDFSELPLFPEAKAILEKYDYEMKRISNDKYNEYIKEVCALVPELDIDITQVHFSGNKRIETTKKKHELIATH